MKGKVLDYSIQQSKGLISGEDGNRYHFVNTEWKSQEMPAVGLVVDFEVDGKNALEIYLESQVYGGNEASFAAAHSSHQPPNLPDFIRADAPKNRLIYILLALFLGYFGVHNFYAGYIGRAVTQLSLNVFACFCFVFLGWILIGLVIAIPLWLALFVWVIIDICTITKDAANQPLQ